MEHHVILTESVPKVASIEPTNRSSESADIGTQNSQPHEYRNSVYACRKTKFEKYDRNMHVYRSVAQH
jgi:hypothetical protein